MTEVLPDEITLPKSATMPDIFKLEEELAQAAEIEEHEYIRLGIDRYRDLSSHAPHPDEYCIQAVKIWATSPFNCQRKTISANRPEDEAFIVSIASLKERIKELEAWYQSQIEVKKAKEKERQDREELVKQCKADGLPMYTGSSHWFEAMNGRNTLSVSVARRLTKAQAIALNDFLNKLEASN